MTKIRTRKLLTKIHLSEEPFEYETVRRKTPQVKGNLNNNLQFWERIGAPRYILEVVEHGLQFTFRRGPRQKPIWLKNNNSAYLHRNFVQEAIDELVQSYRVIEVLEPPLDTNPLSVSVQSNGKKRLILDLRHVKQSTSKTTSQIRRLEGGNELLQQRLIHDFFRFKKWISPH